MAGAVIVALGLVVLVVAILALRNPKHSSTAAGSQTGTMAGSPSGSAPTSASTSRPRSSAHSSTSSHTSTAPTRSTSKTRSTSSSSSPSGPIGSEPLVVLNQSGTAGLADQAAERFRQDGWKITSTDDNYVNDVITTTAYYDPSVSGSQAAAQALQQQFPTIHRVAERFSNLTPGPVVVVLTTDYSSS
jgi:hypothetical protein